MNQPAVSVILPAYNCESFLAKAIQSVLDQTFSDFELIIINDGSTDNFEEIILSFNDPRIVYIKNKRNCGLIFSLNKAIDFARGKYIARMDGDDICLPRRLELQKNYLDENPGIAIVATTIIMINEEGEESGKWKLDQQTLTSKIIRSTMLNENCIAHPTVMGQAVVFKKFHYQPYQKNIEDYDLWLRLLANGLHLSKIPEPLLYYRVHSTSITELHLKKANFFFKHYRMKLKLLLNEWKHGNFRWYTWLILLALKFDLLKGIGKSIKKMFTK